MSADTVKIEPIPENESFLDKLTREGTLDTFVNFLIFLISLSIFMAIVVCVLCYLARTKIPRKQFSFDAAVYIDLYAQVRVQNMKVEDQIKIVKKDGYKPKKKSDKFAMQHIVEEPLELQSMNASFSKSPAKGANNQVRDNDKTVLEQDGSMTHKPLIQE